MAAALPQASLYRRVGLPLAALLLVALVYVFEVGIDNSARRFQRISTDHGISDLFPYWMGARLLIFERQSPYSAVSAQRLYDGYYDTGYPATSPLSAAQFYYPIFAVFLIYPFIALPFNLAVWIWTLLLLLLTAFSVYVWCGLIDWPASPSARLSVALLALGFIGVTNNFFLHQMSGILLPALVLLYWAMRRGYFFLAGSALALFAVKPQLAVLLVPALLFWAVCGWREADQRRRLLFGFVATMLVLEIGAEALLPGWIGGFLAQVRQYTDYTGGDTLITALTGSALASILITVLLVALCAALWWLVRHTAPADYRFRYALCFTLVATSLIIPTFALYNQTILVLPAMLFWCSQLPLRWPAWQSWQRTIVIVLFALLAWNWLAEAGFGLLYLSGLAPALVQEYSYLAKQTVLFLPLLTALALLMITPSFTTLAAPLSVEAA